MKPRNNPWCIPVFLAAAVMIVSCVAALFVGCGSSAPPPAEVDGVPAEAVYMTADQLKEFDAWARERAESPQPEQFRTLQIDAVEVFQWE
jgi:hypothetical protein